MNTLRAAQTHSTATKNRQAGHSRTRGGINTLIARLRSYGFLPLGTLRGPNALAPAIATLAKNRFRPIQGHSLQTRQQPAEGTSLETVNASCRSENMVR